MAKAYSYIRFSSVEQARGDSLRRQTAAAEAWCEANNIRLDDTLRDLGVSAFHGTNRTEGALRRFLELVETGQIERGSYLIVESLDRISREAVMDAASRLFDLIRAGIIVVTLSDGQVYSQDGLRDNWLPLVMSLLVMARAHEESLMKSQRLTAAWQQKKELARTEKKPLTPRCPEWLEVRDGKYQVLHERVEIVRRVFRETIEGFGRREIVKRLNRDGVPTFRGGHGWQTSSVAKIVQNRAVIGEYQPHQGTHSQRNRKPVGEPITEYYPAIIEEAEFWRAQSAVSSRTQQAAGRKGSHAHILQGLAFCSECNSPMHLLNKGKPPKGGKYLCCSSNLRGVGCTVTRRWRSDMLEEQLLRNFSIIEAKSIQKLNDRTLTYEHDLRSIQAKLDDARRRQKNLITLVELEDEAAMERSIALAKEIKALAIDVKTAQESHSKNKADPSFVENVIKAALLIDGLENAEAQQARDLRIRLREIIKSSIDKIVCYPDFGAVLYFPKSHSFRMKNKGLQIHMLISATFGPTFLLDKSPSQEAVDKYYEYHGMDSWDLDLDTFVPLEDIIKKASKI